jgi:hypothetical protein
MEVMGNLSADISLSMELASMEKAASFLTPTRGLPRTRQLSSLAQRLDTNALLRWWLSL